ncbi:hypothetical protein LCGC14_2233750 [marine sediment metagenome]|uniref:Uncharacterized protein n=1 Tax=marine sediment metagenome TaxID=412755 RepID=A0A0F9D7N3_9ZZZZ
MKNENLRGFLLLMSLCFLLSAIVALFRGEVEISKCCGIISFIFIKL